MVLCYSPQLLDPNVAVSQKLRIYEASRVIEPWAHLVHINPAWTEQLFEQNPAFDGD